MKFGKVYKSIWRLRHCLMVFIKIKLKEKKNCIYLKSAPHETHSLSQLAFVEELERSATEECRINTRRQERRAVPFSPLFAELPFFLFSEIWRWPFVPLNISKSSILLKWSFNPDGCGRGRMEGFFFFSAAGRSLEQVRQSGQTSPLFSLRTSL